MKIVIAKICLFPLALSVQLIKFKEIIKFQKKSKIYKVKKL